MCFTNLLQLFFSNIFFYFIYEDCKWNFISEDETTKRIAETC